MNDGKNSREAEAPEGQVYVCLACGKRSKDIYGDKAINHGWDVSCFLNSQLVNEKDLILHDPTNPRSLVKEIKSKEAPDAI